MSNTKISFSLLLWLASGFTTSRRFPSRDRQDGPGPRPAPLLSRPLLPARASRRGRRAREAGEAFDSLRCRLRCSPRLQHLTRCFRPHPGYGEECLSKALQTLALTPASGRSGSEWMLGVPASGAVPLRLGVPGIPGLRARGTRSTGEELDGRICLLNVLVEKCCVLMHVAGEQPGWGSFTSRKKASECFSRNELCSAHGLDATYEQERHRL